jgi:hypothetical protein
VVDKTRELNNIRRQAQSNRKIADALLPPIDIDLGQSSHEIVRSTDGTHVLLDIPKPYRKWKRLFQEEEGLDALPKYRL